MQLQSFEYLATTTFSRRLEKHQLIIYIAVRRRIACGAQQINASLENKNISLCTCLFVAVIRLYNTVHQQVPHQQVKRQFSPHSKHMFYIFSNLVVYFMYPLMLHAVNIFATYRVSELDHVKI